jgi:hypothetical protein
MEKLQQQKRDEFFEAYNKIERIQGREKAEEFLINFLTGE